MGRGVTAEGASRALCGGWGGVALVRPRGWEPPWGGTWDSRTWRALLLLTSLQLKGGCRPTSHLVSPAWGGPPVPDALSGPGPLGLHPVSLLGMPLPLLSTGQDWSGDTPNRTASQAAWAPGDKSLGMILGLASEHMQEKAPHRSKARTDMEQNEEVTVTTGNAREASTQTISHIVGWASLVLTPDWAG